MTDPTAAAVAALARALHEACEARWRIESQRDAGRVFTLHLPDAHLSSAASTLTALAADPDKAALVAALLDTETLTESKFQEDVIATLAYSLGLSDVPPRRE